MALGLDGQAVHRHGKVERLQVDVVVLGGVVQHGVEVQLVDLGDGADVARHTLRHLDVLLALQHEEVADLERLAAVADVELAVLRDGALVDAEHAHAADVRVDRDLEDMGQHMAGRVGGGLDRLRLGALALEELRRVAFGGVGQQLVDDVQQLGHAGAGARRDEAHGDQVPLAQRLLERRMKLGGIDVAVVEVAVDERGIDLHDLLHERPVGRVDRGEVGAALAVEEAVDDASAAVRGQVQRKAFTSERGLDRGQQAGQVSGGVDLVDDEQAVELARGGVLHHAHCHRLDTGAGVDHDGGGVHRFQRRQRLADEVRRAGGVDEVDARVAARQVHQRRVQRVLHAAFERVVVAHRGAALQAALGADGASGVQQGLREAGLAGRRRSDEGKGADGGGAAGGWARHAGSPRFVGPA